MSQLLMAPRPLQTFGWRYDESLSKDENYLDFALCLSRNSRCDGGHMGWVQALWKAWWCAGCWTRMAWFDRLHAVLGAWPCP